MEKNNTIKLTKHIEDFTMKKKTFIKHLRNELSSLPEQEVNDIITDYEEYFSEGKAHKRSEDDIAEGLGDPKKLAKQLKAEYHIKAAKEHANVRNITKAILASISLGLFNLIIVLGPVLAVMAVFIALYATTLSLWIASIAVFVASIVIMAIMGGLLGVSALFASIALFCIATLLFIAINFLGKYFLKGLASYMKINVKIIKGEQL